MRAPLAMCLAMLFVAGDVHAAAPPLVERTHEVAVPAAAPEVAVVAAVPRGAAPPTPARPPPPRLFAQHMSRLL